MTQDTLKSVIAQEYLAKKKYYTDDIDGLWQRLSIDAATRWASAERAAILPRVIPADHNTIKAGTGSVGYLRTIAAQIHLADLGFYSGKIDGFWGPVSKDAASRWQFPVVATEHAAADTPLDVARRYLGTKEIPGKQHNSIILNWYRRLLITFISDDETAWCSTFVNFCALEAGYERTGKLNARSWLDVGEMISLADSRDGDVLIFERGTSGWEGHVTFRVGYNPATGLFKCLGGNQNDEVNISNYSKAKLLGIRRLRSLDQLQGGTNKI